MSRKTVLRLIAESIPITKNIPLTVSVTLILPTNSDIGTVLISMRLRQIVERQW